LFLGYSSESWVKRVLYCPARTPQDWDLEVLFCPARAPQDWDLEVLNCHPAHTPQDFAHMGVYVSLVQPYMGVYVSLVQPHVGVYVSLVHTVSLVQTHINVSLVQFKMLVLFFPSEKIDFQSLPWLIEIYVRILLDFHKLLSTMQYKKISVPSKFQRIRLFLMQNMFRKHDFAVYIQKIQYFVLQNGGLILRLAILYHVYAFLYLNLFFQSLYILPM
jgi:hypothetical protein